MILEQRKVKKDLEKAERELSALMVELGRAESDSNTHNFSKLVFFANTPSVRFN